MLDLISKIKKFRRVHVTGVELNMHLFPVFSSSDESDSPVPFELPLIFFSIGRRREKGTIRRRG
jgi:hypothetical protein